jgi:alkylation response protein AidB-like acyl-CoA dehydrogenase
MMVEELAYGDCARFRLAEMATRIEAARQL